MYWCNITFSMHTHEITCKQKLKAKHDEIKKVLDVLVQYYVFNMSSLAMISR